PVVRAGDGVRVLDGGNTGVAVGRRRAQGDGAGGGGGNRVQRDRRREVVDPARRDRRRAGDVARDVGDADADVVLAVRRAGRVPARRDVRPRAGTGRRDLELDGADARRRVALRRGQRDGAAEVLGNGAHRGGRG